MKKTIYLLFLLCFILAGKDLSAQSPSLVVYPSNQCYSSSGSTAVAYPATGIPGATTYSWMAYSSGCTASVLTYSNGNIAYISFPCCGVYTIVAYGDSANVFLGAIVKTTTISCGGSIATNVSPGSTICAGNSAVIHASGANSYSWSTGATSSSISVSPSVSTCYTVTGTDSSGCTGSAVRCITIGPAPALTVSGNNTICAGGAATLTASGASTYTWYTSQGTFTGSTIVLSPSATACYSLVGVSSSGCIAYSGGCVIVSSGGSPAITSAYPLNICAGTSLILYASGASSYTWQPGGATTSSIAVTPSTTTCYTLTGYGCNGIGSTVRCVTVSPSPVLSISGNAAICAGMNTTLTASGASTYNWYTSLGTFSGSTIVFSPSVSTCYTVSGTNSAGCTSYAMYCVTVTPGGNPVINSNNFNICAGSSAVLSASGASSYTWLPGGATASSIVVTPSTTTCYTLMGYGCNSIGSAVRCVTVGTAPVLSVSGNTAVCAGTNATLIASGASSYTWYTSQGTFVSPAIVLSPSATTCYSLIGSTTAGCFGYAGGCVTVTPSGTIAISGNFSICAGASAVLHASGASSYSWSPGGFAGDSIVVMPSVSTCYTVYGNNGSGCISSAVRCVSVQPSGSVFISGANSVCSGSYLVLSASGGYSYTWTPGGSHTYSIAVTPSVNGCYTLSGTGCSGTSSTIKCFTVNPAPTLAVSGNTSICAGYGTTLTASGASSYTWYTSQGTFSGSPIVLSPSATTCYSLMGNNSFGCAGFAGGCITVQSSSLAVSGNTYLCSGASTTLTASGASSYTWSNGAIAASIVVTPTASTCYTVVGSGSGSCGTPYKVVCITVNPKPVISTSSGFFCAGQSNTLSAFGASSYTWVPFNLAGANVVITPTASGCYTVYGTSTAGCTSSVVGCYSVLPTPSLIISGNNIACSGSPTTFTVSGAQNYTWYPSNTTGSLLTVTPYSSGCYTVLSNYYGCTSYAVKCLSVQTGPIVTAAGADSLCAGSTTTLLANGALSYTWLPGNLNGPIVAVTPTANTCYTIVGTNSNGCIGLAYHCVQLNAHPVITSSSSFFCAGNPGTLSATGATSYTWLPYNLTGANITITPSVSGCYTVVGRNASGCMNSAIGCFSVLPSPVLSVAGSGTICGGASTTLTASGASSYTWLPGNYHGSGIVASPSVSTCYTVIGSSGSCTAATVKCITVQSGSQLYISGTSLLCAGASANLLASGAATYTWNTGSNSPFITVTPSVSTCYTLMGTTSGGCLGYAVKCISVQPSPVVSITGPATVCAFSSLVLTASGAASYAWNTGSTSNAISVAPASSTVYVVTGSNGACSATAAHSVAVLPRPSVSVHRTDTLSHDSITCAGDAVHLYAAGAVTFTWSTGAAMPYITVNPGVTTTYTVSGTNAYGCSNSNIITVGVSPCTGIAENTASLQTAIYPNPSNGKLMLQSNGSTKISYSVHDMLGRELLKGELNGSKEIDLSDYANGTYLIRFEAGRSISYRKLVLEK